MALLLTPGAEKRAAATDLDPPDGRFTAGAFSPFPAVDLMKFLEIPRIAVRVRVVPDGGPFPGNSQLQGRADRLPQGLQLPFPKGRGRSQRMDLCSEKDLVSIDVSDTGEDPLVKEEALDAASAPLEKPGKTPEIDLERLRSQGIELRDRRQAGRLKTAEEAELPDIAEAELPVPAHERYNEPDVLVHGNIGPLEQHLARHLQVKDERPAAFALHEDHLSPPLHGRDLFAFKNGQRNSGRSPQERREKKSECPHLGPLKIWFETADDGLNLGELRHGVILQEHPEK